MARRRFSTTLLLFVLSAARLSAASPIEDLFVSMAGFWTGPGRIQYEGYPSEALQCRAYYNTKSQLNHLSIVLRCASSSNKIELRAQLTADGESLSGIWEERTFNVNGTVKGQIKGRKIELSIEGSGFSAAMSVEQETSNQSVSITTTGVAFNGVSVTLTRKGPDTTSPDGSAAGASEVRVNP
jgi:hypothetical protein